MSDRPTYLLIGNPDNRRVQMFADELRAHDHPEPVVLSHTELLDSDLSALDALPDQPYVVRLESVGEDFGIEKRLLHLGYDAALDAGCHVVEPEQIDALTYDRGRILCPRQQHLGFHRYLERLDEVLARHPQWRALSTPAAIRTIFEKRETSRLYQAEGVPVPAFVDADSVDELRAYMDEHRVPSLFVKISCSSSASGLAIFNRQGGRERVTTTIEVTPDAWYNTLRIRHYKSPDQIEQVLGFILSEGAQIEHDIPKARLHGAFFDVRIVVIDGEPVFRVVRQNRHPITNLHLGGWRGDLEVFEREVPPELCEAANESCRTVARLHDVFALGIDVMFERNWKSHRVLESNAFGDLLPGVERDGLSVYGWQIRAAWAASTARGGAR